MANKSSGNKYTSKGERNNVSKSTLLAIKNDRAAFEQNVNIQTAYWKGQNPWVTIDNPNKSETNKLKVRVRANDLWGNAKERLKNSYSMKSAS
jgi:hypothetical protein